MNLHYLQHVPYEGLGTIKTWMQQQPCSVSSTLLYESCAFPSPNNLDGLIIMGGPMGVHDTKKYPWLGQELQFIASVIQQNKPVLGICLGAQLIAHALGANVTPNHAPEIGWYPVTKHAHKHPLLDQLPQKLDVFHWHGDTFTLPENAISLGQSAACENQGFIWGNHVIGLQFHLEVRPEIVQHWLNANQADLKRKPNTYIQTPEDMIAFNAPFDEANTYMNTILNYLFKQETYP